MFKKNESGYALLLALTILVIFSILGTSLLMLTMNGIKKNENRQNTNLALDLSEKGNNYLTSELQLTLEKLIENSSPKPSKLQFKDKLDSLVNSSKYSCPNTINFKSEQDIKNTNSGIIVPSDFGYTLTCIAKIEKVSNEEKDILRKKLTLWSFGFVNGKLKKTTSEIIIGTDAIPDQLRYAVSTNDGGNLFLHGGVQVKGDIKTDGNLIFMNHATWFDGRNYILQPSVYPTLLKDDKSISAKIITTKDDAKIYQAKPKNFSSYNGHIEGRFLNNSYYYHSYQPNEPSVTKELNNNVFFQSDPISIIQKPLNKDDFSVEKEFNNYPKNAYFSNDIPQNTYKQNNYYITGISCYKNNSCYYDVNRPVQINISKESYYNSSRLLNGIFYINGNVSIQNVNLFSDAVLYVKGNVKIRDSTLNGITDDSTLFIFSTGSIDISNISVDKDTPSKIKGFFYSQDNLIMYGVGSNIHISGGLSAKRIILTAVRGSSTNYKYDSSTVQEGKQSRLQITYDEKLIEQFGSFKRDKEEEYITSINPPEILKRK